MRVIVTATETIQGATIERYIDTICANVVLGSNALADFGASFTDFFGGRSGIYEGKLALIYEKAKKSLIQKAQMIGANAIVGFKVDFDEISAQGKSMFMVAASGTACKVIYSEKEIKAGSVSCMRLREREEMEKAIVILNTIGAGTNNPQRETGWNNWELLDVIEEPTVEFAEALISVYHYSEEGKQGLIESCLSKLDYDVLCDIVYRKYEEDTFLYLLIKGLSLFNPQKVLDLIKRGKINEAASLLNLNKESYTIDDLNVMKEIVILYDGLSEKWSKEVVKGGFMSKDKEVNVCMCGHKNDPYYEFCEKCGRNTYGLTEKGINNVNKFKNSVEILEKMLQ